MTKKYITIIGASGVIGSAVARALDAQGYRLGLHYCTNLKPIEELLSNSRISSEHRVFQSPLNTLNDGKTILSFFRQEFQNLDGLALCAGRVPWKNENELIPGDWYDSFFELAVQPYHMALHFSQICSPKSKVVALSSISAKYGGSTKSRHYGAAKAALESSLCGLSRELAPMEICINTVRAGFIVTPQQTKERSEQEIKKRIQKIPFGRAGHPDEVADVFCFLFGSRSSFITGQCITVSGGD